MKTKITHFAGRPDKVTSKETKEESIEEMQLQSKLDIVEADAFAERIVKVAPVVSDVVVKVLGLFGFGIKFLAESSERIQLAKMEHERALVDSSPELMMKRDQMAHEMGMKGMELFGDFKDKASGFFGKLMEMSKEKPEATMANLKKGNELADLQMKMMRDSFGSVDELFKGVAKQVQADLPNSMSDGPLGSFRKSGTN